MSYIPTAILLTTRGLDNPCIHFLDSQLIANQQLNFRFLRFWSQTSLHRKILLANRKGINRLARKNLSLRVPLSPSPQQTVTAELADMSKPPSGCFAQSIRLQDSL